MIWVLLAIVVSLLILLIFLLNKQKQISLQISQMPKVETPLLLLQQQMESLREQMRGNLDSNTNTLQKQLGALNEQLNQRLHDSNQLLQNSQSQVSTRLDNAAKVVGDLQSKLGRLEEANTRIYEVGKDIRSLQEILKTPKLRGSLGELLLADLLSQILPRENFSLQHMFKSQEKVDAVVKVGDKLVSVDAKFPLENFQRLSTASGEQQKKDFKKSFISDVKKHIESISKKYIRTDENTYDFALMYVPAENIYYEVIIKDDIGNGDHQLVQYAMKKRVIPVSPNTLYVYLHTIVLGLKGMRVEKQAQEILNGLSRLGKDLGKVQESLRKLGGHLHHALGSYEDSHQRLEKFGDRMDRLQGVEEKPGEALTPPGPEAKVRAL